MDRIKSGYKGFVPMHRPHLTYRCAYYHCVQSRITGRRFCEPHALEYDTEAAGQETRKLISF